ncbi:NAD(P)-dependent oxidoreductase [Phenylobacterium sp.]|uniref:NAD-dependent epimerase/dehydratase family protein n=1 Tax=Phenylobacterium sp. TaxID=1871053 RepID=UPI0025F6ABB7|nr:NAD-dependent epimerase/dehydratase family protein [Phenylobacterium sp.]MBX3484064.1 NAD-dependent epimerase/dehydratase family protein [Phenylobacterium sp.]MCW5758687.1 NAD-dependent epimerase/dehydratase family protein [Phenylobacterium sp.]
MDRLVAVTGATGFLGRQLVKVLSDDGWRVRVLARKDPIDPLWRDACPEVVVGDLADLSALSRLAKGADVVIHAAGVVKGANRAAFDRVNVEGAHRVALAARDVAHTVLVSSLTAREPSLSHYSASKRAGEEAMRTVLGPRLSVVRPCAIYGPGDRELLPVFQAADALPVLPVLSETARVAMIHVEDAARRTAAVAAAPCEGRVTALCDDRPGGYAWRELMAQAARACGRTPRFVRAPGAIVRAIGITNDFTALLGGAPMLTSAKARELLHPDWAVSQAEQTQGFAPARYDLAAGFSMTVAWYRSAAWMKH